MTLRDHVWLAVLIALVNEGAFELGDLPFDEGQRHTVRRILREMEEEGLLARDNDRSPRWKPGDLARELLDLSR